jgi:hypothetical protein
MEAECSLSIDSHKAEAECSSLPDEKELLLPIFDIDAIIQNNFDYSVDLTGQYITGESLFKFISIYTGLSLVDVSANVSNNICFLEAFIGEPVELSVFPGQYLNCFLLTDGTELYSAPIGCHEDTRVWFHRWYVPLFFCAATGVPNAGFISELCSLVLKKIL